MSARPYPKAAHEAERLKYMAERLKYMADTLVRFGVKGDLRTCQSFTEAMPLFHEAWCKLGLPSDLFPDQQPWLLFNLIEERLALLSRLGQPSPDADAFFKEIAGTLGGQPRAKYVIDAKRLPPIGERSMTAYARWLGVPRETLRRLKSGLPVSDKTLKRLCARLKKTPNELLRC